MNGRSLTFGRVEDTHGETHGVAPVATMDAIDEGSARSARSGGLVDYLFVARDNNYGLTRDVKLLVEAIGEAGGRSGFAASRGRRLLDWLLRRRAASAIIHIERAFPAWFSAGARNFLIPNQERFPRRHIARLRRIDRVLAKTRHAETIFSALGVPTTYIGFTSEDRLEASVEKDWSLFLHLAGGSTLKGTEDVMALWRAHPEWPRLILVQKAENAPDSVPDNVTLLSGHIDDGELKRLQNACGIHLCPSRAEGWGHHIVEAMSAGAVVVTTDAPPMNEHIDASCGVLVDVARSEPRHLGESFYVDRKALEAAIEGLLTMPAAEKAVLGTSARSRYRQIDASFRAHVARHLGDVSAVAQQGPDTGASQYP